MLMFNHQGKALSLLDLTGDLFEHFGIQITKQSLQERFNPHAVKFMESVLSLSLNQQLTGGDQKEQLSKFNRVRIKDSTKFALPEQFATTYQGFGGAIPNSKSMIAIQYEYDLISGQTMDFRLTNGLCNDQLDSRDHTNDIREGDLFIRDLGYCTTGYLQKIIDSKAYFLNRLAPKISVYHASDPSATIDFESCLKKMKKHRLPYLEYSVLIGRKAKIPCRLIISPVDDATYKMRLRKTQKYARSCGLNVSDGFKRRAQLSAFITNVPTEWISAPQVKSIYGLRWQIELIFKVWKSQGKINDVKQMKIHRFQCQLIGKIIWLLINWKIYRWLNKWIAKQYPEQSCSIWKYYKYAFRLSKQLREAVTLPEKLTPLLTTLKQLAKYKFLRETKNGKIPHYQALKMLA